MIAIEFEFYTFSKRRLNSSVSLRTYTPLLSNLSVIGGL